MNVDNLQDLDGTLQALASDLPGPAYWIAIVVFSIVGMIAFWRGRRHQWQTTKWLGLALMLYPYIVWSTPMLYVVGSGLCVALWFYRGR
jgi:uncharacterized protein (DUF983 family)